MKSKLTLTLLVLICIGLIPLFQNCSGFNNAASSNLNSTIQGGSVAPSGVALKTDNGCLLNLPGDCDSPIGAYSINSKIVTSYPITSPLFTAVRIPDLVTTDILQAGQGSFPSGKPDVTQITSWLASGPPHSYAVVVRVYDQTEAQNHAFQNALSSAPRLNVDALAKPGLNALSMVFAQDTQSALQSYATDPTMGNTLTFASSGSYNSANNTTTLPLAPLPTPTLSGYTSGAYPLIPTPNYWLLPGYTLKNSMFPSGSATVVSSTANSLTLLGKASGKFNANIIFPNSDTPNVFLDLPSSLQVQMNNFSIVANVRTGITGWPEYFTLGQIGENMVGSGSFASIYYNSFGFNFATSSGTIGAFALGTPSSNMDVFTVASTGTLLSYNFGELGSGFAANTSAKATNLPGGSIGFSNQVITSAGQGAFEGYAFLVYPSAISANDQLQIQQTIKIQMSIPNYTPTQPAPINIVYTGFSTVIGHGTDSVLAPQRRIAEDLSLSYGIQTYSYQAYSEALPRLLQTGGNLQNLFKAGANNVLVIRPTVGDSWANFISNWPYPGGLDPNGKPYTETCPSTLVNGIYVPATTLEDCLWTYFLVPSIQLAHQQGWKILVLSSESKGIYIGNGMDKGVKVNGNLQDFLNFKSMAQNGYATAGADAYLDMETNPYFGGDNGNDGPNHCPFWDGGCINYVDPLQTQTYWQPDAKHFTQLAYDLSADMIVSTLKANSSIFLP